MLNDGNGMMFAPNEEWRVEIKKRTHMLNQKYNSLTDYAQDERKSVLREILGELNENVSFAGPITFHYGRHTKVGKNGIHLIHPTQTQRTTQKAEVALHIVETLILGGIFERVAILVKRVELTLLAQFGEYVA